MTEIKSPYRRGADDGAWFGLYLIALFFSSVYSMRFPILGVVSFMLTVSVPLVTYMALRRTYISESLTTPVSSLWMQGIMMFLCGSSLMGAASVVYMKWINPSYLINNVSTSAEVFGQMDDPEMQQIAEGLQRMVETNSLPTPITLVFTSICLAVLTGSILSLITGLLVRAFNPVRPRTIKK